MWTEFGLQACVQTKIPRKFEEFLFAALTHIRIGSIVGFLEIGTDPFEELFFYERTNHQGGDE